MDARINVGELLYTIEYDYPTFHLSMDCFWAEIVSGDLILKEHEAAKWLTIFAEFSSQEKKWQGEGVKKVFRKQVTPLIRQG